MTAAVKIQCICHNFDFQLAPLPMDGLYRSRYFILFMFTAPSPFLPALCLLHPVRRKPEEPVAVHSTYDNMTTARRRVVQTIKPSQLQSSPQSLSPLLAAAFSRSRSCLSTRQNGVQRSCHQPNSDSERQQRSNIL